MVFILFFIKREGFFGLVCFKLFSFLRFIVGSKIRKYGVIYFRVGEDFRII